MSRDNETIAQLPPSDLSLPADVQVNNVVRHLTPSMLCRQSRILLRRVVYFLRVPERDCR